MDQHKHHSELIDGFFLSQKEIFNDSRQGMYVYLDDNRRICNSNFAEMLGYRSPDEWAEVDVKGAFPSVFVDPKSQQTLVDAYQDTMNKSIAASIPITWKKKSGGTVDTTVIIIPVAYEDHMFALHFVSPMN